MVFLFKGLLADSGAECLVLPNDKTGSMSLNIPKTLMEEIGDAVKAEARKTCAASRKNILEIPCFSTEAGGLAAKGVKRLYHAVIYDAPGGFTSIFNVSNALMNIIALAKKDKVSSLAIPFLGTGTGGLEPKIVAQILIRLAEKEYDSFDITFTSERIDFLGLLKERLKVKWNANSSNSSTGAE